MGKARRRNLSSSTLRNTPTARRPYRSLGSLARVGAKLLFKNRRKIADYLRGPSKKSRVFTKTNTYKGDDQIEISQHNDMSMKNIGVYRFKGGHYKKTEGTYLYRDIVPWVISSVAGKQAVDFPEVIFTQYQITGSTSTNFAERYRLPDDLFLLNPNANPTPSTAIYPGPPTAVLSNDYMYIKHVKVATRFLSMETIPQKVTVYWVTPKYDSDQNPITQWESIVTSKNISQGSAGARSVVTTTTALGGAESINTLGSSPWQHIEFRKNWGLVKKQKFVLQPGDQRNITFKVVYNKAINRNTFVNLRNNVFLAGYTVFPIVVIEGGLIGIGSDVASTASEVTTGPTKVGLLTDYQFVMGALPQSRFSVHRHVDHQIINPDVSQYQRMIDDTDEIDIIEKL